MVKQSLTDNFFSKIQSRISELEERTSVEFVPVLTRASSTYRMERLASCLVFMYGWLVFSNLFFPWTLTFNFIVSLCAGLLMWLLLLSPPIFRVLISKAQRSFEVEEAAMRAFLTEEVFATKGRTGVLIFISELEKAVFILADAGLREKVKDSEWKDLAQKLAKDFTQKSSGDTFLSALDELIKRLEVDFPPDPINPNELKDHVRLH